MLGIDWVLGISIFFLVMLMDYLHVVYTKHVIAKNAGVAATSGAVIYFISAFAIINYVHDWRYLFFVVIGSWIGVYFSVKWS